jgi:hypothetical protein
VRFRLVAAMAALGLVIPISVAAQDFGVMESAETINRGNFKLTINPMFIFSDGDDQTGVAIKGGYGFTSRFDMEGKVAFFDGVWFAGGDAEYWIARGQGLDVSLSGGFHLGRGDRHSDTTGFDITLIGSGKIARALDLYAALDLAFESIDNTSADYKTAHVVPGVEYSVSDSLDLVAEVGLALNDDALHYVSGGVAFYFR